MSRFCCSLCRYDGTGIRVSLRNSILQVRFLLSTPYGRIGYWQPTSLIRCFMLVRIQLLLPVGSSSIGRASHCGCECCGFKSHLSPHRELTQWSEFRSYKSAVDGSSPSFPTKKFFLKIYKNILTKPKKFVIIFI